MPKEKYYYIARRDFGDGNGWREMEVFYTRKQAMRYWEHLRHSGALDNEIWDIVGRELKDN